MAGTPDGFAFTYFMASEGRQFVVLTDTAGNELSVFEPALPQGAAVVDFASEGSQLILCCYSVAYLPDEIHRGVFTMRFATDGTPLGETYCIADTAARTTLITGVDFYQAGPDQMEAAMLLRDMSANPYDNTILVGAELEGAQVSWDLEDTLNNIYSLYAMAKNDDEEIALAIRRNDYDITIEQLLFWACDSSGLPRGNPRVLTLPEDYTATDIHLSALGQSFYAVYSSGSRTWPGDPFSIWMTAFTSEDILPARKPAPVPELLSLSVWPNPFNSSVSIEYNLPNIGSVTLSIWDILGRQMETLVQETQTPGFHRAFWNADGHASGPYFIRLENTNNQTIQKILLIR